MTATNGFFAVGRNTFISACNLGINPACALLVMACGTGQDNATTRWSAEAVGNYIGARWTTAREAIDKLVAAVLVTQTGTTTRPKYKLKKDGDLIWLPRTLVEGALSETPPVNRIRQTQDVMTLRLLVELYSAQNLREDGGVSKQVMHRVYERRKAGQQGAYSIWDFSKPRGYAVESKVTKPHYRTTLTDEEIQAEKNQALDFFERIDRLESLGLVDWIPYLFEGANGEPIHALTCKGLPIEEELYEAATAAAARMLTPDQQECAKGVVVPVLAHIEQTQLIALMRLRYRPQTRLTAAWFGENQSVCQGFIDRYDTLAVPLKKNGTSDIPFI